MEKERTHKHALLDTEKWLVIALKKNPNCKFYKGYLESISIEKEKRMYM